jgi:integrase
MTERAVLIFVGYLYFTKGITATSVDKMLSALRMLHITLGHQVPALRPESVKLVLKGLKNKDEEEARDKPGRQPVTLKILELLYVLLHMDETRTVKQKVLIWALSSLAFWGGFRAGELVSKRSTRYDSLNTLLRRDIWLTKSVMDGRQVELLNVRLKSTKTCRAALKGQIVEVFENGTKLCPVRAYKRYREVHGPSKKAMPAFRDELGWAYRHAQFNTDLKDILGRKIQYGKLTAHSFRSGLATLMATVGYSDEEIKAAGRWSSEAFLAYVKRPKLTRVRIAKRLSREITL